MSGLTIPTTLCVLVLLAPSGSIVAARETLPKLTVVQQIVRDHFAQQPEVHPGELISKGNVEGIFATLERAGWQVADKKKILEKVLPDSDPLVSILRGRDGMKFMKQVMGDELIYDRLDRIVRESGGQRMLTDLVKLPDAARYAKMKPDPGLPSMIDFLPKDRSGRTRKVKEYDKATGKLYTAEAFAKQIEKSYQNARRPAAR